MKVNKQISIDVELIEKIQQDPFNVSELCNERIWEYFNNIDEVREQKTVDYDKEINALEVQKQEQKKVELNKEEMAKDGITGEHIKFLKGMSTNIMGAKDAKEAYVNRFKVIIDWTDLLALKRKWT